VAIILTILLRINWSIFLQIPKNFWSAAPPHSRLQLNESTG